MTEFDALATLKTAILGALIVGILVGAILTWSLL